MPHQIDVGPTTPYEDLPQFLTVQQAASYWQCSPWTVYQAIHSGELKYRRLGKLIYIPREEFSAAKAEARVTEGAVV